MAGYVNSFNRGLKLLTRDLAQRHPADAMVWRAEKRIMAVIDLSPLFTIDTVGPYLYSYRAQIYAAASPDGLAAAEAFFMENSFDSELRASVNAEKADLVSYIIPKAKECARALDPEAKRAYIELVIGLLDDYVDYLAEVTGQA